MATNVNINIFKWVTILVAFALITSCHKGGEPVPYVQGQDVVSDDESVFDNKANREDSNKGVEQGDVDDDTPEGGIGDFGSGDDGSGDDGDDGDGGDGTVIGGGSGNGSGNGNGVIGGGSGNGSGNGNGVVGDGRDDITGSGIGGGIKGG